MPSDVVAVINTSPDTVAMLRTVLQQAGFVVLGGYTYAIRDGQLDIAAFVRQHRPKVIVYDVAPPYIQNWELFQHVRTLPALHECQFVITTTNAHHVGQLAGRDERIFEIVGRPVDLDEIVSAVKQAARARPTR